MSRKTQVPAPAAKSAPATRKTPESQRRVRAYGKPRPIDPEQLLAFDYEDLASRVKIPLTTLRKMVRQGRGPRLTLINKHHRFLPKDVSAWLADLRDLSGG